MGYRFLAALALSAGLLQAGPNQHDAWVAEMRRLWHRVQAVPLGDPISGRELRGPWLTRHEDAPYKVEYIDGRVGYVDHLPRSPEGVRTVWQRTRAKDQWVEVGSRGDRIFSHYWRRLAWIEEQKTWKTGSARRNRAQSDEARWNEWMRKATVGDHMKGTGIGSWRSDHRLATRALAQRHTAHTKLEQLRAGKTKVSATARPHALERARERVRYCEGSTQRLRAKLEQGLRQAGERLGAGDALWRCEDTALRLYDAQQEQAAAEAAHATYKSLARRKPEYRNREQEAEAALRRAGERVDAIRRQRRHAMATVMKALG